MIPPRLLEILQHALGVDKYGQGRMYRNHFCAGYDDTADCAELVTLGLMRSWNGGPSLPYFNCYVTEAGREYVRQNSPPPPKLTRSQQRYRRFLSWSDALGGSFKEFLVYEKERCHCEH